MPGRAKREHHGRLRSGDRIEGDHRLALVGYRLPDWMAGGARVGRHREVFGAGRLKPDRPARVELLGGFRLHPAGEALVEPEVVPPRHGDKIAKPEMRHLVRENDEDVALEALRT